MKLDICPDCGIFTQTLGTAPNRQFVIRWKATYFNFAGTRRVRGTLTEGSNTLSVIYGTTETTGLTAASGHPARSECVHVVLLYGSDADTKACVWTIYPQGVAVPRRRRRRRRERGKHRRPGHVRHHHLARSWLSCLDLRRELAKGKLASSPAALEGQNRLLPWRAEPWQRRRRRCRLNTRRCKY